jgi:predicted acyltransferase
MKIKSKRLLSLDALRGFDMFFIMGFAWVLIALGEALPNCGVVQWLATQMQHVEWDGLAHHDTIFPLFLFIAGISFPFSLAKQREEGLSTGRICLRIVKRALVLFLLGLCYNGLFNLDFATLRLPSVLGRIGVAWMFAAFMSVFLGWRTRAILSAIILVGYSLLLTLPAPDIASGVEVWSREGNIAGYIDRMLIPNHIYWRGVMDPEGVLSTLPAIVTAMLGIFTGEWVQQKGISGGRKSVTMAVVALIMLICGLVWGEFQPINKTLWTSAFVLCVGGYSLGMFALFYYIIDVRGCSRWAGFFRIIGVNSITIYLAGQIIDFTHISRFFLGGFADLLPAEWGAVVISVGYLAASWLLLYILDRCKIYLKV